MQFDLEVCDVIRIPSLIIFLSFSCLASSVYHFLLEMVSSMRAGVVEPTQVSRRQSGRGAQNLC